MRLIVTSKVLHVIPSLLAAKETITTKPELWKSLVLYVLYNAIHVDGHSCCNSISIFTDVDAPAAIIFKVNP